VSNWTIAIGIPVAELSRDLNRLLLVGSAGMIGLLFAGLALATYQSNRIAHAVQSLIPPALALGRGEVPNTSRSSVYEADAVAQALDRAHAILQSRTLERDRAEEKKEQAQILTGMKDEFVANVSHELRTPLTSIAGSLGLLAGGASGPLPAPAARLVSIAYNNAKRLVRLINDLLDIGKIESGKMTFDFTAVDLSMAAQQAIDANRALAEAQAISIRLDIASPYCIVRADADRMMQIFTNLLSNAIKFSPAGGQVMVTIRRSDGMGCILVRDHGSGIPAAFRSRIFDKFAQAEVGNARQKSGTGLGLNIVANIVKQHGGTVGFTDAPGGGTVFQVDIPVWTGNDIMAPPA
jgi:signal transduction histidine kinase